MSQPLIATANALHALASVIFVGFYLILSLICLPVLARPELAGGAALGGISKRSRPWLYASMIVFALTGIYLTLVDPNYHGIGNFNTPWAVLMLVKHILILAMVGIGFWYNGLLRIGTILRASPGDAQAIGRFRSYSNAMTVCGILILLLTAFAQVG
jgi:uncharacterized membrane protein